MVASKYIVGTSGFSFPDWVGPFYPPGTKADGMFDIYIRHFDMVELNFTFYSMPGEATFRNLLDRSPKGFEFWVKVNRQITHKRDLTVAEPFYGAARTIQDAGKLGGLVLQFPQSFKRTEPNRRFLAAAFDAFPDMPLAVEFRDSSWDTPATVEGLRNKSISLIVPDAPPIAGLFHPPPVATSRTGYLRLHSRDASKWYQGLAQRYDYSYSTAELQAIRRQWSPIEPTVDRIYVMFNNCHRGQAAQDAAAFKSMLTDPAAN